MGLWLPQCYGKYNSINKYPLIEKSESPCHLISWNALLKVDGRMLFVLSPCCVSGGMSATEYNLRKESGATLFTIAKRGGSSPVFMMDEWISKMWYLCVMECCSALKTKVVLTHVKRWWSWGRYAKWNSQLKNDKYCIIPLTWGVYRSQIYRQKVEWWWREGVGVVV